MSKSTTDTRPSNTRVFADLIGVTHESIVKAARESFYHFEVDAKTIKECRFTYMDGNGRDNLCFHLPSKILERLHRFNGVEKGITALKSIAKFYEDQESFGKYWARLQDEIAYSNIEQREKAFDGYETVPEDDGNMPTQKSLNDGLMIARLVPWDIDQDDNQTYRVQTVITPKGVEVFRELFKE